MPNITSGESPKPKKKLIKTTKGNKNNRGRPAKQPATQETCIVLLAVLIVLCIMVF